MGILKEVRQPDISRPDLKDPFTWASIARTKTKWIRHVGPQLRIDVEKYILGDVLAAIIGDDSNCIAFDHNSELAPMAQKHLLERLDWEITTPETPEDIRERAKEVLEKVAALNWQNKEEYIEARTTWREFEAWVIEQIEERPELKEAEEYRFLAFTSKQWSIFLYGRPISSDEDYLWVYKLLLESHRRS